MWYKRVREPLYFKQCEPRDENSLEIIGAKHDNTPIAFKHCSFAA